MRLARVALAAVLMAVALTIIASGAASSRPPAERLPVEPDAFVPVTVPSTVPPTVPPSPSPSPTPSPTPEPTPKPTPKPTATPRPRVPSVADARRYARQRIGAAQYACLDRLWTRESNWRTRATNRSSGAYGIPQALPGRKMASAGADWRVNPVTQVRWGLRYIKARYGTACGAWAHFQRVGWY